MTNICQYVLPQLLLVWQVFSSHSSFTTFAPTNKKNLTDDNVIEISDDVFENLNSALDLDALQNMLGIPKEEPISSGIPIISPEFRILESDKYLNNPQQAHCEPELQVVDLGLKNTDDVTYYPTCIRVKQCGGCCPQKDLFSCQAIASKKVIVKVIKLTTRHDASNEVSSRSRRRGTGRGRRRRTPSKYEYKKINVTVEEHTDCRCMCQLSEKECDPRVHLYNEQLCECTCKNKDEEDKCLKKTTHLWNSKKCQCLCRKVLSCSSSRQFDHTSCRCVATRTSVDLGDIFFRSSQPGTRILRNRKPVAVPFLF